MPSRPKIIKYVLDAIVELGDKNGSPLTCIIDLVRTNIAIDDVKPKPRNIAVHTRRALKMAIEEGLVMEPTRGRFKVVVDEEDNFIPRIRPTTYKKQGQKNTPLSNKYKPRNDQDVNEFYMLSPLDDQNIPHDKENKPKGEFCASCGGKKRCNRQRGSCRPKQCRKSCCQKCGKSGCGGGCSSGGRCGSGGGCGECRPPPIPKTPCTPPTPRQPCPPTPPCPPRTPCDYFDNEGFDQAGNSLPNDRNTSRTQLTYTPHNNNMLNHRSTDAFPPEDENELALAPNYTIRPDQEPPMNKLYFGPGSLDENALNLQPPEETMDTIDGTIVENDNKSLPHELIDDYIK